MIMSSLLARSRDVQICWHMILLIRMIIWLDIVVLDSTWLRRVLVNVIVPAFHSIITIKVVFCECVWFYVS